ncbi:MAG: flagellar basal-body rod protein FlgG [Nitrospinota bacterium]
MIRSLYTAVTGMRAQQLNIDVISNNLANANTSGFKRSRADFQDLLYQTLKAPGTVSDSGNQVPTGIQLGLGVKTAAVQKIFLQGDFTQTQNELDLVIEGKGFFQVQLPDSTIGFTRGGSLKLDNTGTIVTSDGYPILPEIVIPEDALNITVDSGGKVSVMQPGSPTPSELGTIELANFVNPAGLRSNGNSIFTETDASGVPIVGVPATDEFGGIQQGFIEISNVSVIEELTNMILAQRSYEINSKSIQAADEMLQAANQLKR